ncbi:hypothetical protein CYLTODRAFT_417121 [Cylindrobasidium torrendii FP15055 ss-10]|uniref:Uncharacterized protein n=1 Tax=Cylindrobasidium torrendii FP15055 ss-10 TaxID=1314674 RepID=A0A0D7BSD4_9AGAR|nr:hypothetical protein CYLTODRAFT_417121 [Cylindrobasidium torrendii FP15055 ss-10]
MQQCDELSVSIRVTCRAINRMTGLQRRRTARFKRIERVYAKRSQNTAEKLKRLRRTRDELTELRRTYEDVHAQILPKFKIQHLPHELMVEVFSMAIAESDVLFDSLNVPSHALWILSHVCSGWRAIMLSSPRLWSSLWTDDSEAEGEEEWSPGRAMLWKLALERSYPLPIHVQHIGISPDTIHIAFQVTRQFSKQLETIAINMVGRWSSVVNPSTNTNTDIGTGTNTDNHSDIGWPKMDLPLLTTFAFEVEVPTLGFRKTFANLMGFLRAPHLKTVELRGMYFDPRQLLNPTVRRLRVDVSSITSLPLYFRIGSLVEAEIYVSIKQSAPPTNPTTSTSLRRLSVQFEYCEGGTFFSWIRCPLLEVLCVEGCELIPSSLPKFLLDTQVTTLVVHIPCSRPEGPLPHFAEDLFASIRACSDRLCVLSIHIHPDFASEFYTLLARRDGFLAVVPNLEELCLYDRARERPFIPVQSGILTEYVPSPPGPDPSAFEIRGLVGMVAARPRLRELVLCAQRSDMSPEMKQVVDDLVGLSNERDLNFVVHWGYMWINPRQRVFT